MRNTRIFLLILLFTGTWLSAQVKIGDNPQNINPSSVLELESTDKVLVITRVTTAQMNAIVPIQGALCYNTEVQAVHYYDGTQWVNIGNGGTGTGNVLTADPIVNMPQSTIVITPTADGSNLEIAPESITSEQIRDGGINGTKIQDGSINTNQLVDNAITREKILDNQVGLVELANDEIDLSDFNNVTGFIRAADLNIVSGDVDNALEDRADGVWYNDQPLFDAIDQNTDAIALDNDQSITNEIQNLSIAGNQLTISGGNTIPLPAGSVADGSETIITEGANIIITGNGTTGTPYVINSSGGGTGSNNSDFTVAGDSLRITDAGGTLSVALSELGATGTNQNASQVPFTPYLTIGSTDTQAAVQELKDEVDALSVTGGGNNTDFTIANDSLNITDGGGTFSVPLSGLSTPNTAFEILNDSLSLTDAVDTFKIALSDIAAATGGSNNTAFDVANDSLRITDGDGTLAIALDSLAHTGTERAIFYAGPDGRPTTADDNANPRDDRGFYWDPNGRNLGPNFDFGALYVGLEPGNPQSDEAKVHIADNFPGLTYSLHLQNFNDFSAARTTGILFSTIDEAYGKGSLIFDTQGTNGVGDFHFLQNNTLDTSLPEITDKAFSIRRNKDIVLYGGIEIDGIGTGTNGQVLTSTGAGVQWAAAGSGTTVDVNAPITGNGSAATPLGIAAGGISATEIADDAINSAKIIDNSIATEDIANNAVDNDKIADDAISTIKILDNNITPEKIAEGASGEILTTNATGDVVWAAPTAGAVSVDATLTGDGNATPLGVANDAITSARILDGEVQTLDIANGAITGGAGGVIADNSITASDIANDAVDSGEIRIDAVGLSEIQSGAVASDEIVDESIDNIDIATTAAIDGSKITPTFTAQIDATLGMTSGADILLNGNNLVADYVFQKYFLGSSSLKANYDFQSLEEIEFFVEKYHHLPGIKSADQVKKDGIWNLSDSNMQNLEKIEELFLHTIEQEKKIKTLQTENESLKETLKSMQNSIQEIKTLLKNKG